MQRKIHFAEDHAALCGARNQKDYAILLVKITSDLSKLTCAACKAILKERNCQSKSQQ